MTPVYLCAASIAASALLAWLRVPCALAYLPIAAFVVGLLARMWLTWEAEEDGSYE